MNLPEGPILHACLAGATALALSAAGTALILDWLKRHQRLDRPNDRSSHSAPTPRGAGPALLLAFVLGSFVGGVPNIFLTALMLGAVALAVLGWKDDRTPLSAGFRLGVQAVVVGLCALFLPAPWAVLPALWFVWLWVVNLTNFMDGIDGITGAEMIFIGAGLLLTGHADIWPAAAALAGAALGFLVWNWSPAKVFLGDSGSLPLGLISGGLLILLGLQGEILAALLIPAAYLVDASVTLIRRGLNGEKIWQAHRSHAYQRHARALGSHAQAVLHLAGLNLLLLAAAVISLDHAQSLAAALLAAIGLAAYHAMVAAAEIRAKRSA